MNYETHQNTNGRDTSELQRVVAQSLHDLLVRALPSDFWKEDKDPESYNAVQAEEVCTLYAREPSAFHCLVSVRDISHQTGIPRTKVQEQLCTPMTFGHLHLDLGYDTPPKNAYIKEALHDSVEGDEHRGRLHTSSVMPNLERLRYLRRTVSVTPSVKGQFVV